jgi:hypothetical protein
MTIFSEEYDNILHEHLTTKHDWLYGISRIGTFIKYVHTSDSWKLRIAAGIEVTQALN